MRLVEKRTSLTGESAMEWEPLFPSPPANPPPRARHALYYDPSVDLFIVYGGDAQSRAYDDVWVFRLAPRE